MTVRLPLFFWAMQSPSFDRSVDRIPFQAQTLTDLSIAQTLDLDHPGSRHHWTFANGPLALEKCSGATSPIQFQRTLHADRRHPERPLHLHQLAGTTIAKHARLLPKRRHIIHGVRSQRHPLMEPPHRPVTFDHRHRIADMGRHIRIEGQSQLTTARRWRRRGGRAHGGVAYQSAFRGDRQDGDG